MQLLSLCRISHGSAAMSLSFLEIDSVVCPCNFCVLVEDNDVVEHRDSEHTDAEVCDGF